MQSWRLSTGGRNGGADSDIESAEGRAFTNLLEGMTEFDRGVFASVEQYLRNRGEGPSADMMFRMRRELEQSHQGSWARTILMLVHRLVGYGTRVRYAWAVYAILYVIVFELSSLDVPWFGMRIQEQTVAPNGDMAWSDLPLFHQAAGLRIRAAARIANELMFPFVNEFLLDERFRVNPEDSGVARLFVVMSFVALSLIVAGVLPRIFRGAADR